jgi:hypothetical protein
VPNKLLANLEDFEIIKEELRRYIQISYLNARGYLKTEGRGEYWIEDG